MATWTDYSLPADPAVGAAIREKRLAQGWSLPRLALYTGLNADYLRAVEKARRRPTDATLESILEVLADAPAKPATRRQRRLLRLAAKLELLPGDKARAAQQLVPLPHTPSKRQQRLPKREPQPAISPPVPPPTIASYARPDSAICPHCQLPKVVQLPAGRWCQYCHIFV